MAALLKRIKEKITEFTTELQESIKGDDWDTARFYIGLLALCREELVQSQLIQPHDFAIASKVAKEKKPAKPAKAAHDKRKAPKTAFILSETQIALLRKLLGLKAEKKTVKQLVIEMNPAAAGSSTLSKTKEYGIISSWIRAALKKVQRIINKEVEISSLPADSQQFYQDLFQEYPNTDSAKIMELFGYRQQKKHQRGISQPSVKKARKTRKSKHNEVAKEQKPFRG